MASHPKLSGGPRVVIGAPLYNHASELPEAIESILSQTYGDFQFVLVDDGSTDDTRSIVREYATLDDRIVYHRNDERLGMLDNWRRTFEYACELAPGMEFFAWASDHDVWHPRWLAALVDVLDRHPEVVLAYPRNRRIDTAGRVTDKRPWTFDTRGVTALDERFQKTLRLMSAGNMIYGLGRAEAIRRAGVFRRVLVPDRLLLTELAMQGQFTQVPEVLWFRRWYGRIFSLRRQRQAFFPCGRPLHAYMPWWVSHAVAVGYLFGVDGVGAPAVSRPRGLRLGLRYLRMAGALHARQELKQLRLDVRERATILKPAYERARRVYHAVRRGLRLDALEVCWRKTVGRIEGRGKLARRGKKMVKRLLDDTIRGPGTLLLRAVRRLPLMQSRVIPWLVRQEIDEVPAGREVGLMRRELRRVAASKKPIIVGPWLSEVGFEVLYWIPFLRWAAREFELDRDQLIVVSRGGAGTWYRDIAKRSVDAFELMPVKTFRKKNEARWSDGGNQKQMAMGTLDEEVVELTKERLGLKEATVLHPSVMYRLLRYYWYEKGSVSLLKKHAVYAPLPQPTADDVSTSLPERFVAVRFYFRPSFPDTDENRQFVQRTIAALSAHTPIVLLNTGLRLDDHVDFDPGTGMGVHKLDHIMAPHRNLDIQSHVISRACAFVGTYGGLAYLGPYYGVPSLALYSDDTQLMQAHLDVTRRYSRALNASFVMLHTREIELVTSSVSREHGIGDFLRNTSATAGLSV